MYSKGLFELLDNNYLHGGIQNTMQWCWKLNVMEGHDTWNDSHVENSETSTKKAKFPDFQWLHDLKTLTASM